MTPFLAAKNASVYDFSYHRENKEANTVKFSLVIASLLAIKIWFEYLLKRRYFFLCHKMLLQ